MKSLICTMLSVFLVILGLATSASAHVFRASKLGNGTLSSSSFQVVKTVEGNVECTNAYSPVEFLALEQEVLPPQAIEYRECEVFTLAASNFTISYEWAADGLMIITKPVTIKSKVAGLCKVTIPAQMIPNSLSYTNSLGKLEIHLKITGLSSSAEGTECGYASESTGSYTTTLLETLEGGIISWE